MTTLLQAAQNLIAAIDTEPKQTWAPNNNHPKWEREVYGPAVRAQGHVRYGHL